MGTRGTTAKAKPKSTKKKVAKKASSRKAPTKKAAPKARTTRKRAASKAAPDPTSATEADSGVDLSPVRARAGRSQRVADRDRLAEIDATCNA